MFSDICLPGDKVTVINKRHTLSILNFEFFKEYGIIQYAPYYQYCSYPPDGQDYWIEGLFIRDDSSIFYIIKDRFDRIWIIEEEGISKV